MRRLLFFSQSDRLPEYFDFDSHSNDCDDSGKTLTITVRQPTILVSVTSTSGHDNNELFVGDDNKRKLAFGVHDYLSYSVI